MSMKQRSEEVTFRRLLGACPNATVNPATNKPVDKQRIYDILRTDCFGDGTPVMEAWCTLTSPRGFDQGMFTAGPHRLGKRWWCMNVVMCMMITRPMMLSP